jgi:hypothetical protein
VVSLFAAAERASCYIEIRWRITVLLAFYLIVLATAGYVALHFSRPGTHLGEKFVYPSIAVAAVYVLRSVLRNRRDTVNARE